MGGPPPHNDEFRPIGRIAARGYSQQQAEARLNAHPISEQDVHTLQQGAGTMASTDARACLAHGRRKAIDEEVEKQRAEDASLADAILVGPIRRATPVNTNPGQRLVAEIRNEAPC